MSLKQAIDADLKTAMLSGEKDLTTTLRGLKSSILDEEIKRGLRGTGLSDEAVIELLGREAKKRQESADLYEQAGDETRANKEFEEKKVIEQYLPEQLSEVEIMSLIDSAINKIGKEQRNMGQIIGFVKSETKGMADGATIARLVKEKLA